MNKEDKHYRQNSERIQHKHNTPATRCAGCHDHNEEELILDPESQLLYHRGCKEEFLGHAMDEQILPQKKKSKIKGAIAGAVLGLVGLVGAYALTTSETQQQQPEVVQAAPSSLSIDFIGNYKHLEATVHPVVVGNDGTIMVKDSVAEITKDNQNLELAQGLYVIKGTVDHEFNFQKPMKLEEGSSLESRLILPAKNIEGFMPVSYTNEQGEEKLVYFAETELTFGQWNNYVEHLAARVVDRVVQKHGKLSYDQLDKPQKVALINWMNKEIERRIPRDTEGRLYFTLSFIKQTGYVNLNPNTEVCLANNLPADESALEELAVRGLSHGKLRDYITMSTDVFGVRSPIAQYVIDNSLGQVRMASPTEFRVVATDNGLAAVPHEISLYGPRGMGNKGMDVEFLCGDWEENQQGAAKAKVRLALYEHGQLRLIEGSHTPDHQDMQYGTRIVIVPRQ